jgi:hypothetical protein
MAKNFPSGDANFGSVPQSDVPLTRNGKHKQIVTKILRDLDRLENGRALKIPLRALPDSKANIRSAVSRVARLRRLHVSTASDEEFLYIWYGGCEAKK